MALNMLKLTENVFLIKQILDFKTKMYLFKHVKRLNINYSILDKRNVIPTVLGFNI